MWRLHFVTGFLLGLKWWGSYAIPLWLALLPSYIFPAACGVIAACAFLTGRLIVASLRAGDDKDQETEND